MTLGWTSPSPSDERLRVLIVDDSRTTRELLARWLGRRPELAVLTPAATAREALAAIRAHAPDLVLLDILMPEMDGFTLLPMIMAERSPPAVIAVSALTDRGAEVSLRCLALGAVDTVAKPAARGRGLAGVEPFCRELEARIAALRPMLLRRRRPVRVETPRATRAISREAGVGFLAPPAPACRPRLLVIGASTGGPAAMDRLLPRLGPCLDALTLAIVQHMPPGFTGQLAVHLGRLLGRPVVEVTAPTPLEIGQIVLAPGGAHLRLLARGEATVFEPDNGAPRHHCRPSVDVLLEDVADRVGREAWAMILTGMGHDGRAGAAALVAAGGRVLAQNAESCVVYGMPRAVVDAGLAHAVGPVETLAQMVVGAMRGDRP